MRCVGEDGGEALRHDDSDSDKPTAGPFRSRAWRAPVPNAGPCPRSLFRQPPGPLLGLRYEAALIGRFI